MSEVIRRPAFIVPPFPVTDANLVSSTIAETDYPVYVPGTTYAKGARVIVTTFMGVEYHKIYQSASDGNVGHFPPDNPSFWAVVGPTNKYAAFDLKGGTISRAAGSMSFVITGDRFDTMGFVELAAQSVRVQAYHPSEGTYFDRTYVLEDRAVVTNWYEYFYAPIELQSELLVTDIPPIGGSTYTITISGPGTVSLGSFIVGNKSEIGWTERGASAGINDYSRKQFDDFGNLELLQKGYSDYANVSILVEAGASDSIKRKLTRLRARINLFVFAQEQYEMLTVLGFPRSFELVVSYPTKSLCSLRVEGISDDGSAN